MANRGFARFKGCTPDTAAVSPWVAEAWDPTWVRAPSTAAVWGPPVGPGVGSGVAGGGVPVTRGVVGAAVGGAVVAAPGLWCGIANLVPLPRCVYGLPHRGVCLVAESGAEMVFNWSWVKAQLRASQKVIA